MPFDLLLGELDPRRTPSYLGGRDAAVELVEAGGDVAGADRVVGELGPVADDRPLDPVEPRMTRRVDAHREHDGGTVDVGEQTRCALGQHGRVQRRAPVGQVDRDATFERLRIERVARAHEPADVGDRVVEDDVVAGDLDVEGLIEVDGRRRDRG